MCVPHRFSHIIATTVTVRLSPIYEATFWKQIISHLWSEPRPCHDKWKAAENIELVHPLHFSWVLHSKNMVIKNVPEEVIIYIFSPDTRVTYNGFTFSWPAWIFHSLSFLFGALLTIGSNLHCSSNAQSCMMFHWRISERSLGSSFSLTSIYSIFPFSLFLLSHSKNVRRAILPHMHSALELCPLRNRLLSVGDAILLLFRQFSQIMCWFLQADDFGSTQFTVQKRRWKVYDQ